MERLTGNQKTGITTVGLRNWGMLFMICGIVSRGILQNRMLGMAGATNEQLMDTMLNNPDAFGIATLALVLQAMETCAVPVFCYLLVDGFLKTSHYSKYLTRVVILAAVSEIPYNFAIYGKVLEMSTRNPAFGMVLCLVMLHLFRQYEAKGLKNTAIKLCVFLAALVWANMLKIQDASCCVLVTAVLWLVRNKQNYRILIGCSGSVLCMLFSPFYVASPMGFMPIHFYNGEKGEESRVMRYAMYPVILTIIAVAAYFLY